MLQDSQRHRYPPNLKTVKAVCGLPFCSSAALCTGVLLCAPRALVRRLPQPQVDSLSRPEPTLARYIFLPTGADLQARLWQGQQAAHPAHRQLGDRAGEATLLLFGRCLGLGCVAGVGGAFIICVERPVAALPRISHLLFTNTHLQVLGDKPSSA